MDSGLFIVIIVLLIIVFAYMLVQAFKMSLPKKRRQTKFQKVSQYCFKHYIKKEYEDSEEEEG